MEQTRNAMPRIWLVTSGKGGAGKSTVSVYTAAALAKDGFRVLIVELDAGLRCLDILLGVSDKAVFDLADVLSGRCSGEMAAVECAYQSGLFLLPAPASHSWRLPPEAFSGLCRTLSESYDYLILDTPAGLSEYLEVSLAVSQSALIVVTPDPVAVRDGASVASLVLSHGIENLKLVINRVPARPRRLTVETLDTVIDRVGVQLIGTVPEDEAVFLSSALGQALPVGSPARREFESIASRIRGKYIPLSIH